MVHFVSRYVVETLLDMKNSNNIELSSIRLIKLIDASGMGQWGGSGAQNTPLQVIFGYWGH